jgi:hypothetical protein
MADLAAYLHGFNLKQRRPPIDPAQVVQTIGFCGLQMPGEGFVDVCADVAHLSRRRPARPDL